ncbi:hypothetical protein QQ045_014358 [Rhodiola kirilowii]
MEKNEVERHVESLSDRLKGKLVVNLEDIDWRKMSEGFQNALVLKLANSIPFNLKGLSNVLGKIWNVKNKADFKELANNMALVKFEHEANLVRVRNGGPWHCLDTTVLMHDWLPDLAPEEFSMKRLSCGRNSTTSK